MIMNLALPLETVQYILDTLKSLQETLQKDDLDTEVNMALITLSKAIVPTKPVIEPVYAVFTDEQVNAMFTEADVIFAKGMGVIL